MDRTTAPARRTRPGTASAPAGRPASRPSGGGASYYTGDEGVRRIDEEIEAAKARRAATSGPWRFWIAPGETREFVIVDDKPSFFRYEHEIKVEGSKQPLITGCVKMNDNCPACAKSDRDSFYGMYLTIIDLTPYTKKSTNEEIPFMKKVMLVKSQQQKKVLRLMERSEQGGLLRGAIIRASRDGEKEPRIGNDWDYQGCMPDEELAELTTEWVDKDNKAHVEYGNEPYDYVALYGNVTADSLRALVGGEPAAGSRASNARTLNQAAAPRRQQRDGWDTAETEGSYDGQEGGEEEQPTARRAPRSAPASRSAPAQRQAPAQRAAPAQRTAAPAQRTARPAARSAPPPQEEYPEEVEGEGEQVEEAQPHRAQVRRPQPGARPPAGRRMAPSEQEQEVEGDGGEVNEEPPPQPRRVTFRRNAA